MSTSVATTFVLIALARITGVTLDTVRTVAIVQGRRVFAAILGFFEVDIDELDLPASFKAARPIRFVRKVAKEYGTRNQIEGGPVDGLRVVLIEDVITSGGAVLAAVDAVRAAGGSVDTVVCLIDRQQGGRSALVAKGLDVRAALSAADLA